MKYNTSKKSKKKLLKNFLKNKPTDFIEKAQKLILI